MTRRMDSGISCSVQILTLPLTCIFLHLMPQLPHLSSGNKIIPISSCNGKETWVNIQKNTYKCAWHVKHLINVIKKKKKFMSNRKGTLKINVSHLVHGTFSHRSTKRLGTCKNSCLPQFNFNKHLPNSCLVAIWHYCTGWKYKDK